MKKHLILFSLLLMIVLLAACQGEAQQVLEEVAPTVPAGITISDQAQVHLMDERGRLEGVAGRRVGKVSPCELAQRVVDDRHEFRGSGLLTA